MLTVGNGYWGPAWSWFMLAFVCGVTDGIRSLRRLFLLALAVGLTGCAPFAYTLAGQAAEKAQDAQNRAGALEHRTDTLESELRQLKDERAYKVEHAYDSAVVK